MQAGAVTAAVTGSDFMISNVGKVKVICLSHKVAVYFTANPKVRVELVRDKCSISQQARIAKCLPLRQLISENFLPAPC